VIRALRHFAVTWGALVLPLFVCAHNGEFLLAKLTLRPDGSCVLRLTVDTEANFNLQNRAQLTQAADGLFLVSAGKETASLGKVAGEPSFFSETKLDPAAPLGHTPEEMAKAYKLEVVEWTWTPASPKFLLRLPEMSPHTVVLWLNDDCRPPGSALEKLCAFAAQTSGVAWIDARAPGGWSYGAHRKTLWRVRRCTPAEEAQGKIDTFSGNCVCLPRAWIERVGLPHAHLFPHGIADFDYGLRLHAAGAPLRRLPGVVADNADPSPAASESWRTSPRPMRAIWRDFSSPRSFFHFPAWRRFALRHWGPVWGWAVFAAPYVRWAAIAALRTVSSPSAPGKVSR